MADLNPLRCANALLNSVDAIDDLPDQTFHSLVESLAQSPPESSPRRGAPSTRNAPARYDPSTTMSRNSPTHTSDRGPLNHQHAFSDVSPPNGAISGGPSSNGAAPYDGPQFAPEPSHFSYPATMTDPFLPSGTNWVLTSTPSDGTAFDPSQVMQQGTGHDLYSFDSTSVQPIPRRMQQQHLLASSDTQTLQHTPHSHQQHHHSLYHPPLHISTAPAAPQHMGTLSSSAPAYAPEFSLPANLDLNNHPSSSSSASSPSPQTSPAIPSIPTGYVPTLPYGHRGAHRSSRPSPTPDSAREHAQPYSRQLRQARRRPSSEGHNGVNLQQAYRAGPSEVSPLQSQRPQSFGPPPGPLRGMRRPRGHHHQGEHPPELQSRHSYESTMGIYTPTATYPMQMPHRTSLDGSIGSSSGPEYSMTSATGRTSSSDSSLAAWNSTEDLPTSSYDLQYPDGFGGGGFSPTLATVNQEPSEAVLQQPMPDPRVWNPAPGSIQR